MFEGISFTELGFMIAGAILIAGAIHWIIRPPRRDDTDDTEAEK